MPTYDPTKVALQFDGQTITGFAPETFIKAERTTDAYALTIGADGKSNTRVRSADKSGTIEFTLMQASTANDILQASADADELTGEGVGTCQAKDLATLAGLVHAQNAWVKKKPAWERGKELASITWTIETDELEVISSGIDPTTF